MRVWHVLALLVLTLIVGCVGILFALMGRLPWLARDPVPVLPTELVVPDSLPAGSFLPIGSGRIWAVAYSPDGGTLATAASVGIILYDTVSFQPYLTIPSTNWVDNLIWSPDGSLIAASSGHKLILFDPITGHELRSLSQPEAAVVGREMAWSPDSRYVASSALLMYHADVWIWDVQTGERVTELRNKARFPYAEGLAWSPDGRHLAVSYRYGATMPTGSDPDEVYIWDTGGSPQVIQQWPLPEGFAGPLEWSPDGQFLIGGDQNHLYVVDANDGRVLADTAMEITVGDTFALSRDGGRVALGKGRELITLYDIPSLTKLEEIRIPNFDSESLAWSPDGDALAAASSFNSDFFVWSVADRSLQAQVSTDGNWVIGLAWSPDSSLLAAIANDSETRVYSSDTGERVFTVGDHEPQFRPKLAWSPDGQMLATTSSREEEAGTVHTTSIWSGGGELLGEISGLFGAWSAFDNSLTILTDGGLQLWDLSLEELPQLRAEEAIEGYAYLPSPDGLFYARTIQSWVKPDMLPRSSLVVRQVMNSSQVVELSDQGMSYIRSMAWSPDSRWLAVSYDVGTQKDHNSHAKLTIWSVDGWQIARSFDNLSGSSWVLSWSPDSRWIAATDAPSGNNMALYPLNDSDPIREIDAHRGAVESVAWSPDGNRIASSGFDGQIIIWDVAALLDGEVQASE